MEKQRTKDRFKDLPEWLCELLDDADEMREYLEELDKMLPALESLEGFDWEEWGYPPNLLTLDSPQGFSGNWLALSRLQEAAEWWNNYKNQSKTKLAYWWVKGLMGIGSG